jgi:hypothetical protein
MSFVRMLAPALLAAGLAAGLRAEGDPAEPAPKVTVTFGGDAANAELQRAVRVRGRLPAPVVIEDALKVAGSARGTTLTVNTPGSWNGSAKLTFAGAPPMRFMVKLARMPNTDLDDLKLTSGSLTLPIGPLTAATTTRYFDAKGKAQAAPEGAAYTVTARRSGDTAVVIQLRRSPGARLDRALTVTWLKTRLILELSGGGL